MGEHRPFLPPRLVVLFAVLSVGSSSILIRLSSVHYVAAAGYRMLFTVALMVPVAIYRLRARGAAVGDSDPPLDARSRLFSVISGLFLALHFGFWFKSLQLTSISAATVLVNTHPLFIVLLGALFLRERVGRRAMAWMLAAMAGSAGLALVGAGFGETALEGNLLSVAGAAFVSVYMLIGRSLRRKVSVLRYTFLVYLTTATVLLVYGWATGVNLGPYPAREYAILVAMAVFPTLFGHSLFNWALKYLKTSLVSTAILGEPVFATILAMIIFVEIPGPLTVVFGIIVLFAVYRFTAAESADIRE